MKSTLKRPRTFAALTGLILAGFSLGVASVQAGETNIVDNSTFNGSSAWTWENWSLAGTTVTYDGTQDAGGGGVGSGSLKINAPFLNDQVNFQQAVATIDCANHNASGYYSFSFDVKVDASSTLSTNGDYGSISLVIRQGNGWVWNEATAVPLTNTAWTRVSVILTNGIPPANRDNVNAVTFKLGGSAFAGPVIINIDNLSYNDEVTVDNFNDGNIDGWYNEWGTAPETTYTNFDYYGRVSSGGFRFSAPFPLTPADDWEQIVPALLFEAPQDISTLYTRLNLDLYVEPGSTPDVGGDYGLFEVKLPGGASLGGLTPTNTGTWLHYSQAIPAGLSSVAGFLFQLGHGDWVGPTGYVIDNVSFTPRLFTPPPTLTFRRQNAKGLKITCSDIDTFQRQSIAAISPEAQAVSFVNNPEIVTYSFTIAERSQTGNNFQVHLMLSPDSGGNNSPDYSDANIVFLDIRNNGATFRSKTNQANGNTQLYAAGNPNLPSTTMIGTWSLAFENNTNITITGPGGSTNFSIAPEKALVYAPLASLTASLGCQPNNTVDIGGSATITMFKCTVGATTVFEDHFDTYYDPNGINDALFTKRAPSPAGITVSTNTGWVVKWGIPDTDFVLVSSSNLNLGNAGWSALNVPVVAAGASKEAVIPDGTLPAPNNFFALRKP